MSRITRSQTAFANASTDENAGPKNSQHFRYTKRGSGTGGGVLKPAALGVSKQGRKSSIRTALGDISNRLQKNKDEMPKKKRVLDHENIEKPAKEATEVRKTNELDALVEDVDMKGDSDCSLEEGVAELRLSAVDAADAENPQAVVEYINDIMAHLKETEAQRAASPSYMSKQTDINAKMREILIDWLVEVHLKFKLRLETLYLTVNIIDRFLERRAVSRTKLQLVGCTAMLIASKYEEIYAPEVRDFVYISDKAYTRDQILAMESIMLNTLGFYLTVPTAFRFGERYSKVSGVGEQGQHLINYFMELTMQDSNFLQYKPSEIAAASTFLAKKMTTDEGWNATLTQHTGYDEKTLGKCITDLYALASKTPTKYKAVRKKYLNKKFLEVSKLPVPEPF